MGCLGSKTGGSGDQGKFCFMCDALKCTIFNVASTKSVCKSFVAGAAHFVLKQFLELYVLI